MRESWRFIDADDAERAAFSDLARVRALAGREPVAEPNRLRAVFAVRAPDGRRYFLKAFTRTQLGNLVRNRLTRPRCRDDAAREVAVAQALAARGFAAPRVVAVGTRGPASYCLLAELPGEELRARLAAGRCPDALAERVARHCGAIAAAGLTLPDLSALHVFVDGEDPSVARLAVLDLHRGALRRPRRRDLVRMLRSFARSVKGLAVPRGRALRFAVRLLRAAGRAAELRGVIERLPPFDTHGRYDTGRRAARYGTRSEARHIRELELLARLWPARPGETLLDAPCGRARLAAFARARGVAWHGADRSREMLHAARDAEPRATLTLADATALPFDDRSFDGVLVFRFLHHLPPRLAESVCTEAARLARRFVVVSFFHPCSAHGLQRAIAQRVLRRAPTRFSIRLRTLDRCFAAAGFARTAQAAQAPYLRELWLAVYERVSRAT